MEGVIVTNPSLVDIIKQFITDEELDGYFKVSSPYSSYIPANPFNILREYIGTIQTQYILQILCHIDIPIKIYTDRCVIICDGKYPEILISDPEFFEKLREYLKNFKDKFCDYLLH